MSPRPPSLGVPRACPLCKRELPPGTRPACPGCGLRWDEVGDDGWTFAAAALPPEGGPLLLSRRTSLLSVGCTWLLLLPFAWLPLGLLRQLALGPPLPHGALAWVGLAFGSLLALGVTAFCLAACALALFNRVSPERIEGSGEQLRLRVDGGWLFRRTDVTLAREDVTGAAIRAAGRGMAEVWLIHASGAALRVAGPIERDEAEQTHARIAAWVQPRLRIDAGEAPEAEAEREEDATCGPVSARSVRP